MLRMFWSPNSTLSQKKQGSVRKVSSMKKIFSQKKSVFTTEHFGAITMSSNLMKI